MAYANPVVAVNLSNVNIASPATAAWDGIATSTFTAGTTRLLLARQITQSQNGVWIWNGAKKALTRPKGADQYAHFNMLDNATLIWVQKGVAYGGTCWGVEPAAVIKVDTTAHTLTRVALPDVVARAATTGAAGTVFDVTTHPYKTVDGISLNGTGAPGSDIVLVTDQGLLGIPAPQNNGLYWANTGGAMVRTSEPLTPERGVWVSDGTVNAHSHYELSAAPLAGGITLGLTPLNFSRQKLVVNASDFGACPGDAATDCTAAVLAALANAQTNTNIVPYPTYRELKLPAGAIQLTEPLRITSSNFVLSGAGRGTTNIRPNFQGPWCVIGPTLTDVPPVHSDGPVIGGTQRNCFHQHQGRGYSIDLRAHACGEMGASATKLTVEAWVYFVDASSSTIAGSFGSPTGIAVNDIAFNLGGTGGGALTFQVWMQAERTQNQSVVVSGGVIPIGSWVHVAVDWDNSTIRLLIDGTVVLSTSTSGSPWHMTFIRQKPWEGVWLGRLGDILGQDGPTKISSNVRIGPTRGCLRSVYADGGLISGSTYTKPMALFPPGDSTDMWVINWDIGLQGDPTQSDMFKGYSGGGRPVWFFVFAQFDLLNSLNGVKVSDLGVYSNNGVQCGGIVVQQTPGCIFEDLYMVLPFCGLYVANNSYESTYRNVTVVGCNTYCCANIQTTSGDLIDGCRFVNANYPLALRGSPLIRGCMFSNWTGVGTAGVMIRGFGGSATISQCYWDAESQPAPTYGAILAGGTFLTVSDCQISGGFGTDQPIMSLAQSSADIRTLITPNNSYSGMVDVVEPVNVLFPMPTNALLKIRLLDADSNVPALQSSTNALFSRADIESVGSSGPVTQTIAKNTKTAEFHTLLTTTGTTPDAIATLPLDTYSSCVIDVEVQGRASDGTARATWKISDVWRLAALGTTATHDYSVSSVSAGSDSGAPPVGWSVSLVAASGAVAVQVTGPASSVDWVARLSTRSVRNPPTQGFWSPPVRVQGTWTPLDLAPFAWFRGDVGTASSWTDQSGNSRNAAAGTTAPTATTLNGQAAFSFAGGAWYQNTFVSIATGQSYTVLAVAKAADATGGYLFQSPLDTSPLDVGALSAGAQTFVQGGTIQTNSGNFNAEVRDFPFMGEWTFYSGVARIRVNRFDRLVTGSLAATSGSAGFLIGKGASAWNGIIAELVIVNRPITMSERSYWESYVMVRYSI